MKYLIVKTTKDGVEYRRTKCLGGWTKDKSVCWQFSKQGAKKIVDELNASIPENKKKEIHYNFVEVSKIGLTSL